MPTSARAAIGAYLVGEARDPCCAAPDASRRRQQLLGRDAGVAVFENLRAQHDALERSTDIMRDA